MFHVWEKAISSSPFHTLISVALESLGFGSYISEVKEVLQECKTVALKRRKASSRLENLGIPEEELLRQQQELFAKVSNMLWIIFIRNLQKSVFILSIFFKSLHKSTQRILSPAHCSLQSQIFGTWLQFDSGLSKWFQQTSFLKRVIPSTS